MKIRLSFNWRAYFAEFLGTFVFVFIAAGAALANSIWANIGVLGVALAAGLAISAAMFATVHISGAHLNPAVSLALWIAQKISTVTFIFYVLAQVLASFTAAGLLLYIFGNKGLEFLLGGPTLGNGFSVQSGVIIEAVLTAILVFMVFATMVDRRGPVSFGPLALGLYIVIAGLFAGPISGAALNPARVLGPLVISRSFDTLAVWLVGPAVGSLFGIVYDFVFLRKATGKK